MLQLASSSSTTTRAFSAVVATAAVATTTWYTTASCDKDPDNDFRVEVHLMDKIQQKPYLQSAKEGIPSTLRILAFDLPEMRTSAFNGVCRLSHDKIFVDEIAPSKEIILGGDEKKKKEGETKDKAAKKDKEKQQLKLQIAQKALVKSLVHCQSPHSQKRVGVELLEASVADLNRYKLRKTHQFGNFKYDPGKYYGENKNPLVQIERDEEEQDEVDQDAIIMPSHQDELEAPWNQYAWTEELKLRIKGQVPFGAPMEKSSSVSRYLFGDVYKSTVPSARRVWEWPFPKFFQSDPDGIDGRKTNNCRACHKPHAVIANGAALQRVPSSLRLLQKQCKEADVPLFVIHDPRVWGGNTHQSLAEALRELRASVKQKVIQQALKQHGSSAFSRGRLLGQIETEAKWQAKDRSRKAKSFLSKGPETKRCQSEDTSKDWSRLDAKVLEKKLVERGVIHKKKEEGVDESVKRTYTTAMVDIARRCVQDVESAQRQEAAKASEAPPTNGGAASDARAVNV